MIEKFLALPKEKQIHIINAAMEVFGKNEYKHAVTDDIAAKAGISKGLLFYYFHNKKELYLYVLEYCNQLLKDLIVDEAFYKITDFFEMMEYGADKKMSLLHEYPFITDFVIRAYYSSNEIVSEETSKRVQAANEESFYLYFSHIDFSKFKEGVDPHYIYQMLVWMCDGYLREQQSKHTEIDLDHIMQEFHTWKVMFRKMVYKEEFQ